MKTFTRLMVALDLSDMDNKVLKYTKHLASAFEPDKIYFVHVVPSLEFPEEVLMVKGEKIHFLPLDEKLKAKMDALIGPEMEGTGVAWDSDVLEGKPLDEMLHWIRVKDIDLVVVGNKTLSQGSGIIPRKVVRDSPASVLFVPDNPPFNIKRILVPLDYSRHSEAAMKEAIRIGAGLSEKPEIVCLNVYDVPTELHFEASRTYAQFAEMVRGNAKDAFQNFIETIDTQGLVVKPEWVENSKYNVAGHISEFAAANEVDVVVMGARGLSGLERFLLGSVAEKLLMYNDTIPTIVVKGYD
jgi:nucleotide-binding universal stress UspA family protein